MESEDATGFPADVIGGTMITVFPADHHFLPGAHYSFPIDSHRLFELADLVEIEGIGKVTIANPAFIAFYKITMDRNVSGKQDRSDIRLLKDMGLLDINNARFVETLDILCEGHPGLREKLLGAISTY